VYKGKIMLPAKTAAILQFADRTVASQPLGRLHLGSSTSPKAQELRARYEALHATIEEFTVPKQVSSILAQGNMQQLV